MGAAVHIAESRSPQPWPQQLPTSVPTPSEAVPAAISAPLPAPGQMERGPSGCSHHGQELAGTTHAADSARARLLAWAGRGKG